MSGPRGSHGRQQEDKHTEARGMERLEVGCEGELRVPFILWIVLTAHGAREGCSYGVQKEFRRTRYILGPVADVR